METHFSSGSGVDPTAGGNPLGGLPLFQRRNKCRAGQAIVWAGVEPRIGEKFLNLAKGFNLRVGLCACEWAASKKSPNSSVIRSNRRAIDAKLGEGLVIEFTSNLEVVGELESANRSIRHAAR
ncbi:MAG: hypothetical protein RL630_476 [Verrucomicrobiota bacterium]